MKTRVNIGEMVVEVSEDGVDVSNKKGLMLKVQHNGIITVGLTTQNKKIVLVRVPFKNDSEAHISVGVNDGKSTVQCDLVPIESTRKG